MQAQQPVRRIAIAIALGMSALVFAACAPEEPQAVNPNTSPTTSPAPSPTPIAKESPTPSQTKPQAAQKTVEVYWLKSSGNNIEVVPTQVKAAAAVKSQAPLNEAFNSLLAGPTDPGYSSTIPKGTKLRSLKVRDDGVYVDLSQEFTSGGGSTSMTGRVAQVLYTATSENPNAKVWLNVEGKPLDVLGGEGLELDQPLTRQTFQENFKL